MNPTSLFRAFVLATVLVLAGSASSALAGVYTVHSCFDGVADGWTPQGGSVNCPASDLGGPEGIGAAGGAATFFQNASVRFTAPPGAAIARVEGKVKITQDNGTGWQAGMRDFQNEKWLYCGPNVPCNTFDGYINFAFDNFRSTQVGPLLICGRAQCDPSAKIFLKDVVTFIEDFSPPNLSVSVPSGWVRGTQTIGFDANDNVGVRTAQLFVDGDERGALNQTCDRTRAVPCPNGSGGLSLNTVDRLTDGAHAIQVRAVDSASNMTPVGRSILVDNTSPGQVSDLAVDGGDGWRAQNRYSLTWRTPAQAGVAPIAAVEYEICPAELARGNPACKRGERPAGDFLPQSSESSPVSKLDELKAPGPGEWTAWIWLRDQAGNQNPETAKTATLRLDETPPVSAFRQLDPADPTRIRVASSDAPSGLAAAAIELQRRGESIWRPVDVQLEEGGFATSLDDVNLPDGAYALRARAVDRAGNERSTVSFEGGRAAEVALPVRIKTRLAVGKPRRTRTRRGKRRTTLVSRPEVGYGSAIRLQGRLTTPGANPLPGTAVQVFEQVKVPGASPQPIGTVTTTRTGRFSFRIAKGPSRVISFRYGGTKTIRADVGEVDLRVRASTSFSINRRSVVNGQAVTFSGHLRGGNIPAEGKLVALQALSRGRWRPFATTRASAQKGRWRYTYRFDGTRGRVRYRFRARVLREATYPFTTGSSGQRRVTVRGI